MRPGNNQLEEFKASKGGDPLRIRDDLGRLISEGWESLTAADKELLKWVGVFFRKPTPGKFMMRIRMPNGFARSEQLAAIADLSERLGNGTIDLTTRQQIELRGYTLGSIPEIWEKLRGVNLRTLQTGQDNVRNLNGCALAGLTPHELLDASPIVFELDRIIVGENGNPEFANLPRKFNVTVTGCLENCTHSESQDIALVPATKVIAGTARLGFHVLVGGKMGSGGFTIASDLGWFIEPRQAVEVVLAIIKLFRDEGPREARTKARLAFLLEEWGLDRFRAELEIRLGWIPPAAGQDARSPRHVDHVGVHPQKQPNLCSVGLSVPVGRTRPDLLEELGRLAEVYGTGDVRLTTGQNAVLVNIPKEKTAALLAEPLLKEWPAEPSRFMRGLVSCIGTEYCNLALIETKSRSMEVARELEKKLNGNGPAPTIHWSGCPAGCGNHLAADIGLRGMKVNINGKAVDAVAVYVGGRTGPNARAGQPILEMVPCNETLPDVLATVVKHLDLFKQVERDPAAKDRVLMFPEDVPAEGEVESERPGPPDLAQLYLSELPHSVRALQSAGSKVQACSFEELPEQGATRVTVGGRPLAVFRLGEHVAVTDAECPHAGGPLHEGTVVRGCVVCPWHGYRFDLASGECLDVPGLSLQVYPSSIEKGAVWVGLPPRQTERQALLSLGVGGQAS